MASSVREVIQNYIDISRIGETFFIRNELNKYNENQLFHFLQDINNCLPQPDENRSLFSYVGGSGFSGYPVSGDSYDIRGGKIAEAAYFAACYADGLVLINPFTNVLRDGNVPEFNDNLKDEFAFFINQMMFLEPLINHGILKFESAEGENICKKCISKFIENSGHSTEVDIFKATVETIADSVTARVESIDENSIAIISLDGPPAFVDGGRQLIARKICRHLQEIISTGGLIDRSFYKCNGILSHQLSYITQDLITKSKVKRKFGIKKNLSSSAEVEILNRFVGGNGVKSYLYERMTPILLAKSLEDLIMLRENEWHHFERFRNAMHSATSAASVENSEELYRSVVLPEVANIESTFERNRVSSGKQIIKNSGIAAFAVTSSVISSGISSLLAAAAATIGSGHFAKEMIPSIHQYVATPEEAKDSDYYFAWRLRKIKD